MYFSDDGDVLGMRFDNWKVVFMEQRCEGTMQVWGEPFTRLRIPKIYNLRTDPYERADITSNTTTIGSFTMPTSSMWRRPLRRSLLKPLRLFHPLKRLQASPSTTP